MKARFRRKKMKKMQQLSESISIEATSENLSSRVDDNRSTTLGTTDVLAPQAPAGLYGSSKSYENTRDLAEQFFMAIKEVSEATELLSPLKSVCALMVRGIQTIRSANNNLISWADLCEDLSSHLSDMEHYQMELQESSSLSDKSSLEALEFYLRVTKDVLEKASMAIRQNESGLFPGIMHVGVTEREKEDIDRQRVRLLNAWQVYTAAMSRTIALKLRQTGEYLKKHQTYDEAMPARRIQDNYGVVGSNFAIAYGEKVDLCEEGTRVEILGAIREWGNDSQTTRQIFWLNDAAGTGKSTIAATMAKEWSLDKQLAGRFFFSPNSNMTQTTKEFCRAIAEDIAINQPMLGDDVRDAIKAVSVEQHIWFDVQLRRLIFDLLRRLEADNFVFLVVDALDNCVRLEERTEVLNGFIRYLPSVPRVKLLLTSRPIQDIADTLAPSPLVHGSDIQLLNVRHSYHRDINIFVEKRLFNLPAISREHHKMIVERSGGLFLYAATVCRMLEKSRHRPDILKVLSDIGVTDKLERQMDILYLSVLKQALIDKEAGYMMMSVLSMIIVAYQPLSSNTISRFLPENIYVDDFVQDLGGVLKDGHPDRPIKVLHPTFREFVLSNEDRANGFLVDPGISASSLASACISTLEHILEEDLFQLDKPGHLPWRNADIPNLETIVHKFTTPAERYASAFWAHHVATSNLSSELWSTVINFLSQRLLNWVELMSWRGTIGLCIEGISRLREAADKQMINDGTSQVLMVPLFSSTALTSTIQELLVIRQAHQFIVHHQSLISDSALQTYSIALFFTPAQSPIFEDYRKRYSGRQPNIVTSYVTKWEDQTTLGGHSDTINHLIFSPDGSRLMSVGMDGLLQLWSTETGALVGKPFQGMEDPPPFYQPQVRRCAFSQDGKRFSFFSCPNELHIRFSHNGEPVIPPLEWHWAKYFAFSPTMSFVLLVDDFSVHRREIKLGHGSHQIDVLEDKFRVCDIAISPNCNRVVCVGSVEHNDLKKTGRAFLWQLEPLAQISSYDLDGLPPSSPDVVCIAFSLDSNRFAIWLQSNDALLCDGQSGKEIENMGRMNYREGTKPITFCPLNHLLAHTDRRAGDIIVREQKTGKKTSVLQGHKRSVIHLSFSSDGKKLVSVSFDQTVRVWDVEAGGPLESIFPGYTGTIHACSFSDDWRQFASAAENDQIRLYNLQAGAIGQSAPDSTKPMHDYAILGVAYADPLIAIRSQSDSGVALWDTTTGTTKGRILNQDYVVSVAFSPNGRIFATLSDSSTVRIWNVMNLVETNDLGLIAFYRQKSGGIFFSQDSLLLCAFHTGNVRVWDAQTMTPIFYHDSPHGIMEYQNVKLCAFSFDSTRLAGVDRGNQLYVWNPRTNTSVQTTIPKYYSEVFATFSPVDSSLLAAVLSQTIFLWRIDEELQVVAKISLGKGIYGMPSFSSDGKYLAYGPLCWDVVTPLPPQPYTGDSPPSSFDGHQLQAYSFLFYKDGWIHSAFPDGPLLPLPTEFRSIELDRHWHAFGESVLFMNKLGEPVVIDCSPILARARQN
ncbi:hypothetical protein FRC18_010263 [Serendipita sp. 400]|nr:hypothetical protein FRC18_010263 [Serendipita sp. 400]